MRFCLDFFFFFLPGGGQAVRLGRPDVRRVPGGTLWRQVRPLLLCQRHLPAVLLRVLLGQHPLTSRPRVSQATGEGRGRPPSTRVLPLELRELVESKSQPCLTPRPSSPVNPRQPAPKKSSCSLGQRWNPPPQSPIHPPCIPQTPHDKKKAEVIPSNTWDFLHSTQL